MKLNICYIIHILEECVECFDRYNKIKIEKDRELERIIHEQQLAEKDEQLNKKDNKIGKLTKKKLSLEEKMDKMMRDNDKERIKHDEEMKELLDNNKQLLDKSDKLINLNKKTNKKLDKTNKKLGIAVVDRVPKAVDESKQTSFILMKNPDNTYYAVRCQKRSVKTAIKKYIEKYEENANEVDDDIPKQILKIKYNPNAINLLHRIKETMSEYISFKGNTIQLENITESGLISKIKNINKEKLEVPENPEICPN
jgi:REP element-mobilizing transposase RayT